MGDDAAGERGDGEAGDSAREEDCIGASDAGLDGGVCEGRGRAGIASYYCGGGWSGAFTGDGGGAHSIAGAGGTDPEPRFERGGLPAFDCADAGGNSRGDFGDRRGGGGQCSFVSGQYPGTAGWAIKGAVEGLATGTDRECFTGRAGLMVHENTGRRPVLPGGTIGVLGSGQLGRMFTIAARRMGYRVHTLSPAEDTPTGQVADVEVDAAYEDLDAVRQFASAVEVVTFEFENVPAATAAAAAERVPVRPGGHVLHVTQNRLREKTFLAGAGLPLTPFRRTGSLGELHSAAEELGLPAVLKTAGFGYDGKGQYRLKTSEDYQAAWEAVDEGEAVLEAFIDFQCEISVVAARGEDGSFVHYGAVENRHRNHILDLSIAPGRVEPAIARQAVELARAVLEKLEVVGVLCVEFFVCKDGKLLINELAPRPHNSGHFSFDANLTSQFEQQLRAVCGLPLGDVRQFGPAAMVNLLGDVWDDGEPDWVAAAGIATAKLHLYGKTEPRPGRKMGHITAVAPTMEQAIADAERARGLLKRDFEGSD